MPSVDNRVVNMRFNNTQFNNGISDSISSIDSLKDALKFKDVDKGFKNINSAIGTVSFESISSGIDTLVGRFSALGIAGMTVIQDLTEGALNLGKQLVLAVPRQIISGGWTRATNIDNAKFQLEGLGVAWDEISKQIDYGVKDTAYGLDEAAKVASQLVASGVDFMRGADPLEGELDTMAIALRAISGTAAMTNSSFGEIGEVFTDVAAFSKVTNDSLNSLAVRGLNATAVLGKALGKTEKQIHDMARRGEISFETFAKIMDDAFGEHAKEANRTFEGSFANMKAAMSRIGADFAAPIREGSRDVFNALRIMFNNLRTFTKSFAESGFTDIFKKSVEVVVNLINSLDVSKIEPFVTTTNNLLTAVYNFAQTLFPIASQIGDAWEAAFPTKIGDIILDLSEKLKTFSYYIRGKAVTSADGFSGLAGIFNILSAGKDTLFDILKLFKPVGDVIKKVFNGISGFFSSFTEGSKNLENVKSIFSGVFAVFDIGAQIISGVYHALTPLFEMIRPFIELLLEFGGAIGNWLVKFNEALKDTEFFNNVAERARDILIKIKDLAVAVYEALKPTIDSIKNFFKSLKSESSMTVDLGGLRAFLDWLLSFINVKSIAEAFIKIINGLSTAIGKLVDVISKAVGSGDFNITRLLSDLFSLGFSGLLLSATSFVSSITGIATAINAALASLVADIDANILLKIAKSVALVAASIWLLSTIDSDKLWDTVAAMGALMGMLAGLLKIVDMITASANAKWDPKNNIFKNLTNVFSSKAMSRMGLGSVSGVLLQLASSLLVLAVAVKVLASTENMWDGVKALTFILAELLVAMELIQLMGEHEAAGKFKNDPTKGILKVVISILLISEAVKMLSGIENIGQGIVALVALSALLSGMMLIMRQIETIKTGPFSKDATNGLIKIAATMLLLIPVIKTFSSMEWEELGKAGAGIAGILAIFAGFSALMKIINVKNMSSIGFALIEIATALLIMQVPLQTFSSMSWEEMAKGGAALVGILGAVFGFFALMNVAGGSALKAVGLSASLLIVASSLLVFAGAMKVIATMSWTDMAKGFAALAGVFAVLGVAAVVLSPVIGVILALSAALLMIGVGALTFGAGLLIVSAAMSAFSVSLVAFSASLIASLGIILVGIGTLGEEFCTAFATVIVALCDAIVISIPAIADAILALIEGVLLAIDSHLPTILSALRSILLSILIWLGEFLPVLIPILVNDILILIDSVVLGLLNALPHIRDTLSALIDTLVYTVCELLFGGFGWIIQAVDLIFGTSLYDSISQFLEGGEQAAKEKLEESISTMQQKNEEFRNTLDSEAEKNAAAIERGNQKMRDASDGLYSSFNRERNITGQGKPIGRRGSTSIAEEITAEYDSIAEAADTGGEKAAGAMDSASTKILTALTSRLVDGKEAEGAGTSIMDGLASGLLSGQDLPINAAGEVDTEVLNKMLEDWKINSPSEVTTEAGEHIDEGLALGIDNKKEEPKKEVANLVSGMISELDDIDDRAYAYGQYFDEGLANGISAYSYLVTSKVKTMAANSLTALAKGIESNSPSKATERYGKYYDQGFAKGVEKNEFEVINSVDNLGKSSVKKMQQITQMLSNTLESTPNPEVEVEIVPVLDLNNYDYVMSQLEDTKYVRDINGRDVFNEAYYNKRKDYYQKHGKYLDPKEDPAFQNENKNGTHLWMQNLQLTGKTLEEFTKKMTTNDNAYMVANDASSYGRSYSGSSGSGYDDTKLLAKIDKLDDRVSSLGYAVGRLQVVLDTGTLVGAITPAVDEALGDRVAMMERGA